MKTDNKEIKKYTISMTSIGKFDKSEIKEFLEWILSIKFTNLTIKSADHSIRITSDNYENIEAILKVLEFESYAFKITEILDEELYRTNK